MDHSEKDKKYLGIELENMTTKIKLYKHLAKDLYDLYPDKCSRNFEENKIFVESHLNIKNKKIRNVVAGLITHNMNKLANEEKLSGKREIKNFSRKPRANKLRGDTNGYKRIYK